MLCQCFSEITPDHNDTATNVDTPAAEEEMNFSDDSDSEVI